MGGGAENTLSLLELIEILRELDPDMAEPAFADWRPGDQPIYVSDVRDASQRLGWKPACAPRDSVKRLWDWAKTNLPEIQATFDDR